MPREIKFRIWDKENELFHYTEDIMTRVELMSGGRKTNGDILVYPNIILGGQMCKKVDSVPLVQSNFVIQQGTGVPDKNLKEIYEGDAIRYRGRTGIVRYFAGAYRCEWADQTDDGIGSMITADMEIVGVKYE